ncbi:MAG: Ku protein [Ilumatobacteraceae bacterium]
MAARSIWTGTISFGLIAIPVKLYTAVRHKAVSFNQLDERTMARIKYQKISEDTGEEVPSEHIVKGFEIAKGRYIAIDPAELEPFVPATTKSIDLEEFVDLAQIDPVYFDTAYYIAPHVNPKPYVLLARALESTGKVAIARFVMRSRQYTAAIRATDSRLVMSTLAYADEVVPAASVDELAGLDDVAVADREVKMAEALVESLSDTFDPDKYEDEYRVQVLDLIAKKAAGEAFELPAAVDEPPKIVDMMAALEASVEAAKAARRRHPTATPASKKAAAPTGGRAKRPSTPRARKSA